MAATGRPSDYSEEIVAIILGRMAEGESVRAICRDENMPATSTVFLWLQRHVSFSEQYARAAQARADVFAEDILEIADDGTNDTQEDEDGRVTTNHDVIARSRLRVDTRKWLMSKMAPKKYGDKVTQEHSGPDGGPIKTEDVTDLEVARRIAFQLERGARSKI